MLPQQAEHEGASDRAEYMNWESAGLRQMRTAIAAVFFEDPRQLDIRHLWVRGGSNFFRVNWWSSAIAGTRRIVRSAFVAVEACDGDWRVRELTARRVA